MLIFLSLSEKKYCKIYRNKEMPSHKGSRFVLEQKARITKISTTTGDLQ